MSDFIPFRRAVEIVVHDQTRAAAEVEDDHHHFRVEVEAVDGSISRVQGTAVRHPWTLCAMAAVELERLVGLPVSSDPTAILAYANIRQQCTHMFDMAVFAVAALGRDTSHYRRYEMTVSPIEENLWRATLIRNDGYILDWLTRLGEIASPPELEGKSLKAPFTDWASRYFDAEAFEAALLLRRAIFVGKFRHKHNLDLRTNAEEGSNNMGACFVMQPGRAGQALRNKGATKSFPLSGPGPLDSSRSQERA